jgi:CDP-diacylglycerol---serine O-phosphatidyltransferase
MVIRNIPNFITLSNLLCGALAIWWGDATTGVWLIILAAALDFADGLVARALGVSSPLGRELDSLADVISFGLAPALLLKPFLDDSPLSWLALALPAAAAWRLARFNVDTEQSVTFKGLPAPGNGLLWVGIIALLESGQWPTAIHPGWVCALSALLMVSTTKLLSFKFKDMRWQGNESRYTVVAVSVIAALLVTSVGYTWLSVFPLVLLLYIVVSIVHYYILRKA